MRRAPPRPAARRAGTIPLGLLAVGLALGPGCDGGEGDDDVADDDLADDDVDTGCVRINDGGADYYYIQDAVDAAVDGDVISMCGNRLFLESVRIDKALTLVSRNEETAEVRGLGGSPAFTIVAVDGVTLDRVKVEGADAGVLVQDSTGVVLKGLDFNDGGPWGLRVTGSEVTVEGSVFTANSEGGIDVEEGSTLAVTTSAFRGSGRFGIRAFGSGLSVDQCEFAGILRPEDAEEGEPEGVAVAASGMSGPVSVAGSEVTDGWLGVHVEGGDLEVRDSALLRMEEGIHHVAGAVTTTLQDLEVSVQVLGLRVDGGGSIERVAVTAAAEAEGAAGLVGKPGSGSLRLASCSFAGLGAGGIRLDNEVGSPAEAVGSVGLEANAVTDCGTFGVRLAGLDSATLSFDQVADVGWDDTPTDVEGVGILIEDVADAVLDEVSVAGTDGFGIRLSGGSASLGAPAITAAGLGGLAADGGATVLVADPSITDGFGRGVLADGASVEVEGGAVSEIAGRPDPFGGDVPLAGAAVEVRGGGSATLSGTTLDGNARAADVQDGTVALVDLEITTAQGVVVKGIATTPDPSYVVRLEGVTLHGGDGAIAVEGMAVELVGCTIEDVLGDAVDVTAAPTGTIADTLVSDATGRGVVLAGVAEFVVERLTVRDSGEAGLVVLDSSGLALEDVEVSGAVGQGVRLQDCADVTASTLGIDTTAGDGLVLSGSSGVVLAGGSVRGSTGEGIVATASSFSATSGISTRENLGGGLVVDGGSAALDGLVVTLNAGDGIAVSGGCALSGSGVQVTSNAGVGLRSTAAAVSLAGSLVDGNDAGGLVVTGGSLDLHDNGGITANGADGLDLSGTLTGQVVATPISSNTGYGIDCHGGGVVLTSCHNPMSGNGGGDFREEAGCDLGCAVD